MTASGRALDNTRLVGKARMYPKQDDPRIDDNLILPTIRPRFMLERGDTVFTIGSCFAREIEAHLEGFDLPTMALHLGPELVQGRPNSILNEYNAASMAQRIDWAISGRDTSVIPGLTSPVEGGSVDLLLSKGYPVSDAQITRIRQQIDGIYTRLPVADCVILTLGMTEVWFDNETGIYLNRLPSVRSIRADAGRYSFVNMTPAGCYEHMATAIQRLRAQGVSKVLLTVSPVPLGATFEARDCVISNSYSKAVLRVVADMLMRDFDMVDYFPSYEIVLSRGMASYQPDMIHVRVPVVQRIMRLLVDSYVSDKGAGNTG